jgi:hypothetical protein
MSLMRRRRLERLEARQPKEGAGVSSVARERLTKLGESCA